MASKLADILQQEYRTKGLIGGTASAFGKSSLEKMDIRNVLFGGSGLGSIVGRKVFGKGYSAIDRSSKTSEMSAAISGSSSVLQEISINGRVTAKNTMALPAMASQMNIMQKNIAKLVKIQGATPSTKADSYFSSAKFRENAYEASFNKNAKGTTPTMVSKEEKGGLGGILGLVSSLFVGLASKLGSFGAIITGLVGTFAALGTLLMGTVRLITGLIGMLPGGKMLLKGLKIGALAAGGLFAANALSRGNESSDILGQGDERSFFDRAGQAAGGIGGAAVGYMGLKAGSALGSKSPQYEMRQSTIAEKGGKMVKAGEVGSKSMGEKLEKIRKFAVKITSKKQNTLFFKLLGERVGKAIAFKAVTLFASFAAAPFTAGISLLITIASAIMLGYEIYQIYDAIFGKDGIETALDAMDKAKGTADSTTTPEAMSFEDALIGAFAEALGLNQPTPTSPTPVPTTSTQPKAGTAAATAAVSNLGGQQQTYATMGGGEFGPDMLAATGVGADRVDNTSPSKVSEPEVEQILATIRQKESNNDYGAKNYAWNQGQTASGAYQFTKPTWQSLTKKYGIGTEYEFAKDAPPNIQDEVARRYVKEILKEAGGDVSKVPLKWYTGNIKGEMSAKALAVNKGLTSEAYQASWMKEFNKKGSQIAAASSTLAAANRPPAPTSGGNQTTNIIGGGSGSQSAISVSAANPYDTELARILTQGMVPA